MPIVRLYPESEVSPQPLPNAAPNVPAAGDIALFGGNQARDLQLAGQNLGQASDQLFSIYQRHAQENNDSRVQDLNNQFLDRKRAVLQTGPEAYYSRQGADAIKGADATTAQLMSLRDEVLGQASNPYQRDRLAPILDTHLAAANVGIARHVVAQQEAYNRGVAATALDTARAEAIADPTTMDNAVLRAEGAARVLHAGQPPEAIEAGARTAGSSVIAGVIGDRLARNDPMGVTLFRQHAERLDPIDRSRLGAAADTLSNTLDAASWVRERSATLQTAPSAPEAPPVAPSAGTLLDQEGIAGTRERLDEIETRHRALTALNQQEFATNPARLRANQAAIEGDTAQARAAVKTDTDSLYAGLRRYLTSGGPNGGQAVTPPPATIMSRLTDAQQDAVTAQVTANIEGRASRTDPQPWYAIRQGLTSEDAGERQRWAGKNLVQFMGQLSTDDLASLEKLQTTVRTNDGSAEQSRLQNITRMANDALRSIGIDPTPRPDAAPGSDAVQAARFDRALHDELSAFESNGRKPTEAEAYDIVNRLKETGIKSGWLKVADKPAPAAIASDAYDDAFHQPGVQLAQAESPEQPLEHEFRIKLAPDFETFHRQMEEYRQREAAERSAAIPAGSSGAPATEPYPGSTEYEAADAQAAEIGTGQTQEESPGSGSAPPTEPPPGSLEYRVAEAEARRLDAGAWENLGFFGQLGVAFKRFDAESRKSGAALAIDSNARRQAKVSELEEKARTAPDGLDLAEKRYLLRNRNAASDLAGAVVRLADAQRHLEELPSSDPLRRLSEASTVAEAGRLLRDHPGEIARAIGVESLPALTLSLITMAALGPVGGAVALTGTSGLDGYAKGLVGALARAGVDVSSADDLTRALQDKALMERVRNDATTDGAIEAGVTAAAMMVGLRRPGSATRTTAKTSNASLRTSDGAKAVAERGRWAPEEIFEAPGSVGAARVWTTTSRLKAQGLPGRGAKIRFVPDKKYDPRMPLPRGPNGGFRDRFDNEWMKGASRTKGQPFEWDVQLSTRGKRQLGWASRDNEHLNVSIDGRITHR